jgi:hypothetical protein
MADANPTPLPPRRPPSLLENAPTPRTEATLPSPARPEAPPARTTDAAPTRPDAAAAATRPDAAPLRTPSGETKRTRSVVSVDPSAPQPDNRNFFQRLFGAFSQPSTPSSTATGPKTAVYDIAAHTVYMPNGERLEAHSGLGSHFDDPRSISVKNRGVTPPNVYDLSLRAQLFHGVAALRLTPVNESSMFGRDGMLAHTYMLGARGDSNGCISFRDYARFLRAYQNGEITRLVVVTHSGAPMSVASTRLQ